VLEKVSAVWNCWLFGGISGSWNCWLFGSISGAFLYWHQFQGLTTLKKHQTASVEVNVQYPSVPYQMYSLWADVQALLSIRNLGCVIGMAFAVNCWMYQWVPGLTLSLVCQWKVLKIVGLEPFACLVLEEVSSTWNCWLFGSISGSYLYWHPFQGLTTIWCTKLQV